MQIRPAKSDDLETLTRLSREVHIMHREERDDEFRELSDEVIRTMLAESLSDKKHTLLVSCVDKQIIGYILVRIVQRSANPLQKNRSFCYLEQIAVHPDHRHCGTGRQLINAIKNEIRSIPGIDQIILDVWSFNSSARAFFVELGFTPMCERMELGIDF